MDTNPSSHLKRILENAMKEEINKIGNYPIGIIDNKGMIHTHGVEYLPMCKCELDYLPMCQYEPIADEMNIDKGGVIMDRTFLYTEGLKEFTIENKIDNIISIKVDGVKQTVGKQGDVYSAFVYVPKKNKIAINPNCIFKNHSIIDVEYVPYFARDEPVINIAPQMTNILDRALSRWGTDRQLLKGLEELNELSVEIAKGLNYLSGQRDKHLMPDTKKFLTDRLIDEVADSLIMLKQIEMMLENMPGGLEKLNERIEYKVSRVKDRLDKS